MRKRFAGLPALLLALLLCLSGSAGCALYDAGDALRDCAGRMGYFANARQAIPDWEQDAVLAAEEAGRRTVPFGEMEYERPDTSAQAGRLDALCGLAANADELTDVEPLLEEANAILNRFGTMYRLAMIHSSMDKSDPYWLEEERVLSQAGPTLQTPYQELYRVLYDSPLREQIETGWSADFFAGMERGDFYTDQTQALFERESELVSDYWEQLATLTADYRGLALTYADILELPDYESYAEAYALWLDKNNPVLAQTYLDLVGVRNRMAKALGCANYTELAFSMNYLDYTPEMARGLLDDIERCLVPVKRELLEYGTHYDPQFEMDNGELIAFVRGVCYDLDPGLSDTFDAMLAFDLYDFDARPYKDGGAFTTYLPDYDAPFILATYDGTSSGMTAILHEFGHFNDYYVTWDSFFETTDTAEIFSQALVLLASNAFYGYFDPETAYMMQYDCLSDMLDAMLYQPYFTAMEFEVYSLPADALTVDNVNRIAARQAARFDAGDICPEGTAGMDWVTTPHLFESPFYTFAYVTSGDVALQLFEWSQSDPQAAMEAYYRLLLRDESEAFLKNVEAAGLKSPFAPGRAEHLSGFFERYLVEEDWSLPAAA